MITGADYVVLTASPPAPALEAFLDRCAISWPDMRIDADDRGFVSWAETRRALPPERSEICVARDAEMERAWDEHGYDIPGQHEGPFMVMYRACPVPRFTAELRSDPYAHGGTFQPYSALIAGRGIYLITLVISGDLPAFTTTIIDRLLVELDRQSPPLPTKRLLQSLL